MNGVCKICFKDINDYSLYALINKNNLLCEECFSSLKATFRPFSFGSIKGTAIYDYNEKIKELIYKYKGCYDYELKDVFLYRYIKYLRIIYRGYILVTVPSYHVDDERRGFNHVEEIYKPLKLKIIKVIHKDKAYKQSNNNQKDRSNIKNVLEIDKTNELKGKKVLLVDDILTTGHTLLSCIDLLKELKPKKIEILVIAKTKRKTKNEY